MRVKSLLLCGIALISLVGLPSVAGPSDPPGGIVFRLDKLSVHKQGESTGDEPYLMVFHFQIGVEHDRESGKYSFCGRCYSQGVLGGSPGHLRAPSQSKRDWAKTKQSYALPGAGWDYKECICCPSVENALFIRKAFYTDAPGMVAGVIVLFFENDDFIGTSDVNRKDGTLRLRDAISKVIEASLQKEAKKTRDYGEAGVSSFVSDLTRAVAGANLTAVFQNYAQSSGTKDPDNFGGIGLVLVGTFPKQVTKVFVGVPTTSGTIKLQTLTRNKPYSFTLQFPNSVGSLPSKVRYLGQCTLQGVVQVCDK